MCNWFNKNVIFTVSVLRMHIGMLEYAYTHRTQIREKSCFYLISCFTHVIWFYLTLFRLIKCVYLLFIFYLVIFAMFGLFDIFSLCLSFNCNLFIFSIIYLICFWFVSFYIVMWSLTWCVCYFLKCVMYI